MKVTEILHDKGANVHTIWPTATLLMATEQMSNHRIGALVVLNDQGDVVGLLSERDVVESLARFGAGVSTGLVGECMTRDVITCSPDDRVNDLMAVMTRRRVRHLCVMDNGQLAGMISIGDLVKSRLNELELESNVLRDAYLRVR